MFIWLSILNAGARFALNNSSSRVPAAGTLLLLRVYVESDELNKDERFFLYLLASYDLAFREGCILNKD